MTINNISFSYQDHERQREQQRETAKVSILQQGPRDHQWPNNDVGHTGQVLLVVGSSDGLLHELDRVPLVMKGSVDIPLVWTAVHDGTGEDGAEEETDSDVALHCEHGQLANHDVGVQVPPN